MKLFRLTGLLGCAVIALVLATTSCSKSNSNSAPKVGTLTFTLNGKAVTMAAVADTTSEVVVTGVGPLMSATDTAQLILYMNIYGGNAYTPAFEYTGNFADSSFVRSGSASLYDFGTAYQMYDNYTGTKVFNVDVTSNNGSVVSGTFSGWIYLYNGAGPDSLSLTNGKFSVQLQ